jgi:hypothetical protein
MSRVTMESFLKIQLGYESVRRLGLGGFGGDTVESCAFEVMNREEEKKKIFVKYSQQRDAKEMFEGKCNAF